jgi:hypothetical protein
MGITGSTVALGHAGVLGSLDGKVTVSVWNDCTLEWEEQQVVTGSDTTDDDAFGAAVSLLGDSLVVGAPQRNSLTGGVYYFTRSGTTWTQKQNFSIPNCCGRFFGFSIAQTSTTLIVSGMGGKDPTSTVTSTGAVEVYTKGAMGNWVAQTYIVPSTAQNGDAFGYSVALDSSTFIGGAPTGYYYSSTAARSGKAWIFTGSGASWTRSAELAPSDGATNDWFGESVAVLGTLALVGAPKHDAAGTDAGAVYVYTSSGGVWSQTAKLTASDATADAWFGYKVAVLSSTKILVGAAGAGKLYTLTLSGGTWSEDEDTYAGCTNSAVGHALGVSGNLALSGKTTGLVFDLADPDRSCVGP